jgi:hypothetical protein
MHGDIEKKIEGLHPGTAIAGAVVISFMMVLIPFIMFLHSSAYDTVKQIKIGSQLSAANLNGSYDVTSPVNAIDIANYEATLKQKLTTINNNADFNQNDISNQTLGLPAN